MSTADWIFVLAALFRLRGSSTWFEWTGRGATSIRLLWAFVSAGAAWLVSGHLEVLTAALLGLGLWLGCILPWWGSLGVRDAWEVAKHSARGLVWVAPAAAALAGLQLGPFWPLLLVGALCGPVYLANRLAWPGYAVQGAEWMWGGMIAAALLLSVQL